MKKPTNASKSLSISLKSGQNLFKLNELSKDKFILKTKSNYIELLDCQAKWVLEDPDYKYKNESFKTPSGSSLRVMDNNVVIIDVEDRLNINTNQNVENLFHRQVSEIATPIALNTRTTGFGYPTFFLENSQQLESERVTFQPTKEITKQNPVFKTVTNTKNSAKKTAYAPVWVSELKDKDPHIEDYSANKAQSKKHPSSKKVQGAKNFYDHNVKNRMLFGSMIQTLETEPDIRETKKNPEDVFYETNIGKDIKLQNIENKFSQTTKHPIKDSKKIVNDIWDDEWYAADESQNNTTQKKVSSTKPKSIEKTQSYKKVADYKIPLGVVINDRYDTTHNEDSYEKEVDYKIPIGVVINTKNEEVVDNRKSNGSLNFNRKKDFIKKNIQEVRKSQEHKKESLKGLRSKSHGNLQKSSSSFNQQKDNDAFFKGTFGIYDRNEQESNPKNFFSTQINSIKNKDFTISNESSEVVERNFNIVPESTGFVPVVQNKDYYLPLYIENVGSTYKKHNKKQNNPKKINVGLGDESYEIIKF